MQVTFRTRLRDEALYPLLDAIAALYQRLQRRLFVDLYVRRRPVAECKRESVARHGLTARQPTGTPAGCRTSPTPLSTP